VSNQKHNSCKIYLKIIQVVSKGRQISWLAGGVIMIPLLTKMAAIAENRKFDKKNHLTSSPLRLTWPIGTRLLWNGPCRRILKYKSEENIKIQIRGEY
jgi:hypothetical protein